MPSEFVVATEKTPPYIDAKYFFFIMRYSPAHLINSCVGERGPPRKIIIWIYPERYFRQCPKCYCTITWTAESVPRL
jgi:hypothetical protein